jgi:hypothetical protein
MTLGISTRDGPYEIRAALSAGGMGEVYLARDTRLDRDVALKVLPGWARIRTVFWSAFDRGLREISAVSKDSADGQCEDADTRLTPLEVTPWMHAGPARFSSRSC